MRDAGWEVAGIDPDPLAAKFAEQAHSIRVIADTLPKAQLADQSLDAVTLSHVIEHAADPIGLLRECRRILRPGGKVIVVTPNLASHGHRDFRDSWVHLDPPRHFYLFSPATLRSCSELAGLHVELLRTSTRTAAWVWTASDTIRQKGNFNRSQDFRWRRRVEGMRLLLREEISRRIPNNDFAGGGIGTDRWIRGLHHYPIGGRKRNTRVFADTAIEVNGQQPVYAEFRCGGHRELLHA